MATMYFQSPMGTLRVRENSGKIIRVDFRNGGSSSKPAKVLRQCASQLSEYFFARRKKFDLPIGLQGTPFQLKVWRVLRRIPYGTTVSYKQIAARAGKPRAIRAAASAVGDNPLCLIVPCHRVIASDGRLGGYAYGLQKKKWLLKLEQGESAMGDAKAGRPIRAERTPVTRARMGLPKRQDPSLIP